MLTHAEILSRIENKLRDTANTYYSDAYISEYMGAILKQISYAVPLKTTERHPSDRAVPTRGTYTTDGTTRDIILTDWDADDLVKLAQADGVEYAIYELDYEPKSFRNFYQRGKIVSLDLNLIPDASKTVYVYPDRLHILQEAIGTADTAGAVSTAGALAATSLVVKSLGTGTVNKYTKLTIAGDTTEYMVTATATIAANVATVSITPGLVVAADVDDVVTLALADSTLSPALEEVLIKWVSGSLIEDYGIYMLPSMPIGANWQAYTLKGQSLVAEAKADLRRLQIPDRYVRHSKD
ncbi:MAG: hypothetical protein WC639_04820 [Patescibacteria group bacterium]|jgi:hypothetical protein